MLLRPTLLLLGMTGMMNAAEVSEGDLVRIAQITGIPGQALQVSAIEVPQLANCQVFDALDLRVKGANAAQVVARLGDAWVSASAANTALEVLDSCAGEGEDPRALAQLIGALHQPRLDAQVALTSALVDSMLRKAGIAFQPPESRRQGDGQEITFMALGPDGQALYRVSADWRPGVSLNTQIEQVSRAQLSDLAARAGPQTPKDCCQSALPHFGSHLG